MSTSKGHTLVKKFKCDYCLRHFPTQSSLRTHKKTHSATTDNHTGAKKGTTKSTHVTKPEPRHVSNSTARKPPMKAATPLDGRVSRGTATPTRRPGQTTPRRPGLPTPRTPQTPEQHVCRKCQKKFQSRADLVKHISTHTVNTPDAKRQRILHGRPDYRRSPATKPAPVLPFKCDMCNRKFRQSVNLNAHVLSHVNKPGYNAGECSELYPDGENSQPCFSQYAEKKLETKHENDESRETMDNNGGKVDFSELHESFGTNLVDLNKAVKSDIDRRQSATYFDMTSDCDSVESDIFPYRCTVCNLGFDATSELLEHSTLHMRDKPYTCATCRKSFGNRKTLKLHEKVHVITKLRGILEERSEQQTGH